MICKKAFARAPGLFYRLIRDAMVPVLPISIGILFIGALVSGIVAAMSARYRQMKQLQRSVISLAVFSSVCMLVTAVYWIPGAFFQRTAARFATSPPPVMPGGMPMAGAPIGPYR